MPRRLQESRPLVIGLDTNALSALVKEEARAVSQALQKAVSDRRVRVPLTYPLAMEVCAAANRKPDLHADLVGLLRVLCRDRMRPFPERIEAEVLQGRRLRHVEVFEDHATVLDELDLMANREESMRRAEPIAPAKEEFLQDMRSGKRNSPGLRRSRGLDRNQWRALLRKVRDNPRSAVSSWIASEVDVVRETLELKAPRRGSEERTPTLWYQGSYQLGLIKTYEEGGGPEGGDFFDRIHVMSAAYLDHFVTQEKRIRKLMEWAPVPSGQFVDVEGLGDILGT